MKYQELKHEKFIVEKGINVKDLPKEIIGVISTIRTTIFFKTTKPKDDAKRLAIEQEFVKISETLYDFLVIWLENPEIKEMDLSEIFADQEIEVEVKQEVKEQVQEIKEQVQSSEQVINKAEVVVETIKPIEQPIEKSPETVNPTSGKLSKRDILHNFYTNGKTKVTDSELEKAGYPMGFFDESIYANTGEYKLRNGGFFENHYIIEKIS
jgi:hypothetical protein